MSAPKLCGVCRERLADVPDRTRTGRVVKRICHVCHATRLVQELIDVAKVRAEGVRFVNREF